MLKKASSSDQLAGLTTEGITAKRPNKVNRIIELNEQKTNS